MHWPLDLPARLVLALPGHTEIAWAVFDPAWYIRTHGLPPDMSATDALGHYLGTGQAEGYSPNIFFDEPWHRAHYPDIAAGRAAGHYTSAFDAYCRRGSLDRSAHWLFSEGFYRDRHPDLTHQVLAENGLVNGYDHYLRHGVHEGRCGHSLFDPHTYLAQFDEPGRAAVRRAGSFLHYLHRLETAATELRTSVYFDPGWYRQRYPEVAAAIDAGRWKSALHHYLCNDTPTAFDPHGSFSEAHYLQTYPELAQAVAERQFRNGYMHFLRFGMTERRAPCATLDLAWYARQHAVKADLAQGRAENAFAHFLAIGQNLGLPSTPPAAARANAEQATAVAAWMADALLPLSGRFGHRFDTPGPPAASVILIVREALAITMATIASLRASTALPIELIVIDLTTDDATHQAIGAHVPGARTLRLAGASWSQAAEAGRQLATAPLVLFLSATCRLAPHAIDRACTRMDNDPAIGAVGGMILQPHGTIAQAGGILWRDGTAHDYMAGESPLAPQATFVRVVDHVSAEFLLLRAGLLEELGGLDPACAPGYEAADLCLRLAAAGRQAVYDPSAVLTRSMPLGPPPPPCSHLLAKHAERLAEHAVAGGANGQLLARQAGPRQRRILFLEDTVPLRHLGSGFVRSNDILRAMTDLGASVTVFPVNGCDLPLSRVYADMPATVEVMHTMSLHDLGGFLRGRDGFYDLIWIARAHNLRKTRPVLARMFGSGLAAPRIVLDTEALTPFRDARMAALAGQSLDPEPALSDLLELARPCVATVAVTPEETSWLRQRGLPHVVTVGHAIAPRPSSRPFSQRAGLLFVGAVHTADSPNLDSLHWFAAEVLPLIEAELGWETHLAIAGYVAPRIDIDRLRNHPRIALHGALPDLEPLYDTHRVFIAPTRYAAGAPYKVLEAASRGLPVACTDVLRHQLGWHPGQEIVTASETDPAALAAAILALYRDESLWHTVREGALRRVRHDHGWAEFTNAVALAMAAEAG